MKKDMNCKNLKKNWIKIMNYYYNAYKISIILAQIKIFMKINIKIQHQLKIFLIIILLKILK